MKELLNKKEAIMKLFITLFLSVCSITAMSSTSISNESGGIKIHSLNSADEPLQEAPEYKNVRIVELEKVPLFLQIDRLKKIEMGDNYLFIQSSLNLYTYTLDGKLVAQIGRKGEREDEYNELSSFYIDNDKKQITIIDYTRNKLINYNFWGNYLFTDTVPENTFQWTYQTLLAGDNKLLSYNGMSMNDTKPYSLFDLENKTCKRYFSYEPITVGNYVCPFSWHPMAQVGQDIDFIMPLCDTIYSYSAASSSVQPKYIVESSPKIVDKTKIRKRTPNYDSELMLLGQEGYFTGYDAIYETNAKVLLQYRHYGVALGYFLFDKTSRTGNFHLYASSEKDTVFPFRYIIHAYNKEIVAFAKSSELQSFKRIKDKKIRKRIESLREESLCLVFYELE